MKDNRRSINNFSESSLTLDKLFSSINSLKKDKIFKLDTHDVDLNLNNQMGIYLHFPFCAKVCPFCSFAVRPAAQGLFTDFLVTLNREIDYQSELYPWIKEREVCSVYFGGGTPSLLREPEVIMVMESLRRVFKLSKNCVISFEVNPENASVKYFRELKALGVNRLSLGCQSTNDELLSFLGRVHDSSMSIQSFEMAREAGICNINVDFIYGVPEFEPGVFLRQASEFASWKPDHISAYALSIERGTPFYNRSGYAKKVFDYQDTHYDLWKGFAEIFSQNGLDFYEISNFATAGFISPQNLIYWRGGDYLGLGPSAQGKVGHMRTINHSSIKQWSLGVAKLGGTFGEGYLPHCETEKLDVKAVLDEWLLTGLRSIWGCGEEYPEAFAAIKNLPATKDLISRGKLSLKSNRLVPTKSGILIADEIALRLSVALEQQYNYSPNET